MFKVKPMLRPSIAGAAVALSATLLSTSAITKEQDARPVLLPMDPVTSVWVMLPSKIEADPGFANGCWVRLYDRVDYKGEQLTLIGPTDLPQMTRTGTSWRDWDSAVIGPKALVTVYDGEGFNGRWAGLEPRQRIADMSTEGFGRLGDINSVRVSCSTS